MNLDPRSLDAAALDRELVRRRGLAEFARQAWHVLEPTTPLAWGWCLDALCDHLEAVTAGEIRRLKINVPPGTMKSLLASVLWPAWEWTINPTVRVISTSYKADLSTRDSRRGRDLVSSEWFRARWPEIRLKKESETFFENDRTGWRQAVAFTSLTGGRADRLVIDDPHSTEGAESEAERARAVRILRESVPSRLVDPARSAIVLIMQRLHASDCSGEIDRCPELGYESFVLPMRFEPKRRCRTSIGFVDPRTEEGELLFPERYPESTVRELEASLGPFGVAGQLQQRPAPREGGIVKMAWFENRWRERGEKPLRTMISLDCASKAKKRNDPSAALVAAEFRDRIEIWHYVHDRMEFPALVRWTKDLWSQWRSNHVIIEDKDAGQQLLQQLREDKESKLPVVASTPDADKATRLMTETGIMEAGRVWLPEDAPWVAAWLEEITTFPAAPHDESADTLSQVLRWIRENPVMVSSPSPITIQKQSNRISSGGGTRGNPRIGNPIGRL
jgi:predicted phage terminase large subunit-like protein